ncbi:type I secretion system permease/ATPase [Alloalcanivorax xenomutans]|uniref:Type I secretion system permease/ATPase n=1 Tax=Alloalcanivorax xenomutans TaxID=1094342 RepID=A0A9Q3W3F3_9GAMM|nr:type I secretion system permease/ATPase [Alloalcanivorax xenomutans]MCE7507925.1 type I secretion system permease/ATPase [Alloalcanivorax xenomutans]MCE7521597.1 type I secretion system permease/ATPase [Alloalcanivorax xenomutans]
MKKTRDDLRAALALQRGTFVSVGVFSAVINLLMLVPALYMLQVYDRVLASGNGVTLLMLTMIALGLYALMAALDWLRGLLVIRVGEALDQQLGERVYDAAGRHGLQGGNLSSAQALSDLNQLRQFFAGSALFAFFDAPWAPLYLIVLFLFHPLLGALALLGALVLLALAFVNERWSRAPLNEASALSINAGRLAQEHWRGAATIKALGMGGRLRRRWRELQDGYVDHQHLASERSVLISAVTRALRLALQSLMLGAGAWLAIHGQISAGMMVAGSILVGRMLAPVEQVVGAWRQWSGTRIAVNRLQALLQAHPRPERGLSLPRPQGALMVEGLTLMPPGAERPSLANVRFELMPGEVLGVVGPSGSGKSSLARALVGLWPPRAGKVRLDGADLHGWPADELGPAIGYLPQEVDLFAGTVAENIARFGELTGGAQQAVIDAARRAGVHDMILRLPQGYDTVLGEDGGGLSGGQKQRVALARALYGEPALLVLDEPNANLDDVGEAALAETLKAWKAQGRTVVLITHRAAVLAVTDKVLVLKDGVMRKFGVTAEVMGQRRPAAKPAPRVSYSFGAEGGGA